MENLKSCHFCGGEAAIGASRIGNAFVYCTNCNSATDAFDDDKYEGEEEVWINGEPYYKRTKTKVQKAIIAWNRRCIHSDG